MRVAAWLLVALPAAACAQAAPAPPARPLATLRMDLKVRPDALAVALDLSNTGPGPLAVCAGFGAGEFRVTIDDDTLVLRCAVMMSPPGWEAAETELPRLRRLDAGARWQGLWMVPLPVRLSVPAPPDAVVPATVRRVRASLGLYPDDVLEAAHRLPDGTLQTVAPATLGARQQLIEAVDVPARVLPLAR